METITTFKPQHAESFIPQVANGVANFCNTTSNQSIKFQFRLINTGDRYGRNNCLTNHNHAMIEVWDMDSNQFVSRYYLTTLLRWDHWSDREPSLDQTGLCLDGGVPAWTINAYAMRAPVQWMLQIADVLKITPKEEQ